MKPRINTVILLALGNAVAILLSVPLSAQNTDTNTAAARTNGVRNADSHTKFGPTRFMAQSLNLSEPQTQKLEPILKEEQAKVAALRRDSTISRQQRAAKLKEIGKATNLKLQTVLTPGQIDTWQRMRTNHQNAIRQQVRPQPQAPR